MPYVDKGILPALCVDFYMAFELLTEIFVFARIDFKDPAD